MSSGAFSREAAHLVLTNIWNISLKIKSRKVVDAIK